MKKSEIHKLEHFTALSPERDSITVSVYLVYRGSFNDERQIAAKTFKVSDLVGKPVLWIDAFLGKKPSGEKPIALAAMEKRDLYIIEKNGCRKKAAKINALSAPFTADYDDKYIISAQII